MATLIIGGNGLVGTRLVKYLCEMGEEVISFSAHAPAQEVKGCVYVQGDVTEYGTLNMLLKNYPVERILHNAAVSHPKLFRDNPYKIYRTNVLGTMISLEAARNYGISRYLYMSSGAVYGNISMDIVTEEVPMHAENPYGATKVACEELVRNYGLDAASLRIGFVYGPGRKYECPINQILTDCMKKGEVSWERGRDQKLDYIYLEDCVKAIAVIAMAKKLPHTEYNVGGGEIVPYTRVIQKAEELYPQVKISIGDGDLGYDNLGALSVERAAKDFGWRPEVCIEEGMERYNDWLKRQ
ncbi:MAG: NAD(P)-dependent oxidoreductase [Lachnospiraceae bacterium]|jgi:nucleoside-diphosphate-sugar epimerase|nr:NAD(P)-dependent oxidoreductase [Lachnospiraceae bacterium]